MNYYFLSDLTNRITKGTTPTTVGGNFCDNGINFIKSEQIQSSRRINYNSHFYIDNKTNEKLKRSILKANDILISIAGAYLGKIVLCHENDLPANTNQAVGIITPNEKIMPLYLYYYISSAKIQNYIKNCNSQSAQPNINLEQIGNIKIGLPSISTQQHIVDTITNNLLYLN